METITNFAFLINHLQSMGPKKLASANLPFDQSRVNGVSMRSIPLISLMNGTEEVFLQSVNGRMMLIYVINMDTEIPTTLQFFLLPAQYSNVVPNYEEIRPSLGRIRGEEEESILKLINDRISRSENAQRLIDILRDNLTQDSSAIPDINPGKLSTENFPLAVFHLTQLGPSITHLDKNLHSIDWRKISVVQKKVE